MRQNCSVKVADDKPEALPVLFFERIDILIEDIIFGLLFAIPIIAASIADIRTRQIPYWIFPTVFGVGVIRVIVCNLSWVSAVIGLIIGWVPLYIMARIKQGGVGGGDIFFAASSGFFLGFQGTLSTLIFALSLFLICAMILTARKKIKKGDPLPFVPFLAIGCAAAYILNVTGVMANEMWY